jgi:hypothetical protein
MIDATGPFVVACRRHGRDARDTVVRLAVLVMLVASTASVSAQPLPSAKSAAPDVVKRAETTRVTLAGDNIADAAQVLFAGPPGVSASIAKPAGKKSATLDLDVTAAPDAPRGLRELRVVTKFGVTRPILISVDDLPAVAEKEPNNSPGEAQPVQLPAVITGRIQDALDVDCFRFDAKKGQRLIFDVQAFRTGSKLDASLSILDPAGRRVAHDEDTNGLDPLIDFAVPADGAYTLRLQDLQYKGGPDYAYRIRAGEIPYVDAIYPLGGQRGRDVTVELKGRNLADAARTTVKLDPADAAPTRDLEAPTPAGATNAVPFAVSDLPEVTEESAPSPLAPPIVVNGRIAKPNESDAFKFKATAAGPLVLEIAAARFGSRLDALLTLADEKGNVLQRNDDSAGVDARLQFTAEKDKVYQAIVRDLTDKGGDNYAYRLSIAPPRADKPDFDVALVGPAELRLNKGGTTALRAAVTRKAGFKPDVTVTLAPLPPGVSVKPLVVSATQPSSGVFTVSAAPDAAAAEGFFPINVVATAKDGDKTVTKTLALSASLKTVPQVYLTLHEPAPFRIDRLGPAAESDPAKVKEQVAALEKQLSTTTPELAAAQAKWEASLKPSASWEVLEVVSAVAAKRGTKLVKQPDGSIRAEGENPPTDKFTVTTKAPATPVRFIRLEAIADGGRGPGRAENGNFVLTQFAASLGADRIEFASAKATFSQDGWDVANSLTSDPGTGWAVSPQLGKDHHATYVLKAPLAPPQTAAAGGAASTITFTLDHASPHPQHVLGHFRLLATAAEKPDDATALPAPVAAALKVAPDARTKEQRDAVAAYYRSVAPQLAPVREKLAGLKTSKSTFPPVLAGNAAGTLDVTIVRDASFDGDLTLTLEGFSAGVDDKTKEPATFAKSFDSQPVVLKKGQSRGTLTFKPKGGGDKGTRDAVLRAEATVGNAKYTVYSQTFPITVK